MKVAKNKTVRTRVTPLGEQTTRKVLEAVEIAYPDHPRAVDTAIWQKHVQKAVDVYGAEDVVKGVGFWLATDPKARNIWPLLWKAMDEGAMFSLVEESEQDAETQVKWDYLDDLHAFAKGHWFQKGGWPLSHEIPAYLLMFVEQGFGQEDVLALAEALMEAKPHLTTNEFVKTFPQGLEDPDPVDLKRLVHHEVQEDGSVSSYLHIERAFIGDTYADWRGWSVNK